MQQTLKEEAGEVKPTSKKLFIVEVVRFFIKISFTFCRTEEETVQMNNRAMLLITFVPSPIY